MEGFEYDSLNQINQTIPKTSLFLIGDAIFFPRLSILFFEFFNIFSLKSKNMMTAEKIVSNKIKIGPNLLTFYL